MRERFVIALICFGFLTGVAHADISAISPTEGTVGTQFTLSGSGFGGKQGKVLMGAKRCKVLVWSETVIRCEVTKAQPPGDYPVTVSLQGNKKRSEPMTFSSFAMRAPRITPPGSLPLVPDGEVFTIDGAFFGDKKGEVTLVGRRGETEKAKVVDWSMDSIRFEVRDAATEGCILRVSNAVGEDELTHPSCSPPLPGDFPCYDRGSDPPPSKYYDAKYFHDGPASAAYYDGHLFFFSLGNGTVLHDPPTQVQRFENGKFVADTSVPAMHSGETSATIVPLVIEDKLWVFVTGTNGGLYYTRYSTTGGWEDQGWLQVPNVRSTQEEWEIAPVYNPILHRIEVYYDHDGNLECVVSNDLGATWTWLGIVLQGISAAPSAVFYQEESAILVAVGEKNTGHAVTYLIQDGQVTPNADFGSVWERPFLADLGSDEIALIWHLSTGYVYISKLDKNTGQWGAPYKPIGNWIDNWPPNGFINYEPNATGGLDRIFYLLWGYPDCSYGQSLAVTWVMNRLENLGPFLYLTKSASPTQYSKVGDLISYTLVATNDGNLTLSDVIISDPRLGPLNCTPAQPGTLAPSESLTCTGTYRATQADLDAGKVNNTASASGMVGTAQINSSPASASVGATQNPHLTLSKTAGPTSYSRVGDVINYTLKATNGGNVTLSNVSITDPTLGTLTCAQPVSLAPGASLSCTGSHTVTQTDLDAGSFRNTAGTTGTPPAGPAVSATAAATANAVQTSKLDLLKQASTSASGSWLSLLTLITPRTIYYQFKITNSGNVTINAPFTVSDPMLNGKGVIVSCPATPTSLAPNASLICTASYAATQADIDKGGFTNTATASGKFNGNSVSSGQSSVQVTAGQDPALSLSKGASPTVVNVGNQITYTYTVTNTGNVTLAGPFEVTDSRPLTVNNTQVPANTLFNCGSGPLAPGAKTTCTATYTATVTDVGEVTNTAMVKTTFNGMTAASKFTPATVRVYPKDIMTDTMLCTLLDNQFRLVLTPDQTTQETYELNASNPGQYYYNMFYVGSGNTDITVTLPYPWVTQGPTPIHVYSDVGLTPNSSGYCLTPAGELSNEADQVTLANYNPQAMGSTTSVVTIHVPALSGGFAYINLHLDYGLKGTAGYQKGGPIGNDVVKADTTTVVIPDKQPYVFSDTKGGSTTITGTNNFKEDPGIGGLVLKSTGDPVENAQVEIFLDTSNTPTATVYTDEDGWYMWEYKWTGKTQTFTVKMTYAGTSQSQTLTLKAKGYLVVNFTVP